MLKCFAIRRNCWKKLMQGDERRQDVSEYKHMVARFEKKILIEFLNRTYFSI